MGHMVLEGLSKFEQFLLTYIPVNICAFSKFYFLRLEANLKWTYDALSVFVTRKLLELVRTMLKNNLFTNNYPENLLKLNQHIFILINLIEIKKIGSRDLDMSA